MNFDEHINIDENQSLLNLVYFVHDQIKNILILKEVQEIGNQEFIGNRKQELRNQDQIFYKYWKKYLKKTWM